MQHPDKKTFDVVVVGSGFGGAVTAARLAQAGKTVLVLERGREWTPESYPRGPDDHWWFDHHAPHKHNGWMDLHYFGDMAVATGAGVGGGSLIYGNISVVPPESAFEQHWPSDITFKKLQPYYEKTGRMLTPREIPDGQEPPRYHALKKGAEAVGAGSRFRKLPLAVTFREGSEKPDPTEQQKLKPNKFGALQGECNHCGFCCAGCPVQAKNTLDLNYLALARHHGAVIRPMHVVSDIRPLKQAGEDTLWQVSGHNVADGDSVPFAVEAKQIILAAGSLGSTELLLRARDITGSLPNLSSQLGKHWSSNGDFITFSTHDEAMHITRGPTISAAIDYLDGGLNGSKAFIEDGALGDLPTTFLTGSLKKMYGWFSWRYWRLALRRLIGKASTHETGKHLVTWFAQAVDASNGVLHLGRPWWRPFWGKKLLKLDWNIRPSEKTFDDIHELHRKLAEANQARHFFTPPTWTLFKDLITPHPLGGCRMADSIETGVVNSRGEVFGYRGLFVADGSIIPYAIGLNPSRTIAALAEHIAAEMCPGVHFADELTRAPSTGTPLEQETPLAVN